MEEVFVNMALTNVFFFIRYYRAHTGPVLALTVSPNGDLCFSGGVDTTIRCWNMPSSNIDPYDSFGKSLVSPTNPQD
jgi:WD40 repeat protein